MREEGRERDSWWWIWIKEHEIIGVVELEQWCTWNIQRLIAELNIYIYIFKILCVISYIMFCLLYFLLKRFRYMFVYVSQCSARWTCPGPCRWQQRVSVGWLLWSKSFRTAVTCMTTQSNCSSNCILVSESSYWSPLLDHDFKWTSYC